MTTIQREWEGATAFILAGGPSLNGFDGRILARHSTITVNNAWEIHPRASWLHFADAKWWNRLKPKRPDLACYKSNGSAVASCFFGAISTTADDYCVFVNRCLRSDRHIALSSDRSTLAGTNSGYQAINIAVLLGVKRIVLLGFDGCLGPAGETHWHEGHREHGTAQEYRSVVEHRLTKVFTPAFGRLVEPVKAMGIEIIHGTPTAMPYWPFIPLGEIVSGKSVAA